MTELMHQPGFLGTSANWAADVTLLASALVALLLTIGVVLAVRGQYGAHRVFQTLSLIHICTVLFVTLRTGHHMVP